MVLTLAVVCGLSGGLVRACVKKRQWGFPHIVDGWLLPVAILPQLLGFFLPVTRSRIPDKAAAVYLMVSQLMLLAFVWLNRSQHGFWALGLGLALNTLVIAVNGGWMPISPQTLLRLNPQKSLDVWTIGQRLGASKDIVLPFTSMVFPLLADRIVFPPFLARGLAYSLGDMFIALGAFLLLFSIGDTGKINAINAIHDRSLREEGEV